MDTCIISSCYSNNNDQFEISSTKREDCICTYLSFIACYLASGVIFESRLIFQTTV
nr:MAG TPA: hypothetical protein [Caudoviricetes sp.]